MLTTTTRASLLALALACGFVAHTAQAATLSLSVSDSVSAAVGSVSTSLKKSSDSSTKAVAVNEGDYKVTDVALLDDQPGTVRLTLQATAEQADKEPFYLLLPQQAVDQGQVREGSIVTAKTRPFGVTFAAADTREPFFIVMEDNWYQELTSRAVVL